MDIRISYRPGERADEGFFGLGAGWDSAFSNSLRCAKVKRPVSFPHHGYCTTYTFSIHPKALNTDEAMATSPATSHNQEHPTKSLSFLPLHAQSYREREEVPPPRSIWTSDSQACLLCQPWYFKASHQAPPLLSWFPGLYTGAKTTSCQLHSIMSRVR